MRTRRLLAVTAITLTAALGGASTASALVTPGPFWTGVRPPSPITIIRR